VLRTKRLREARRMRCPSAFTLDGETEASSTWTHMETASIWVNPLVTEEGVTTQGWRTFLRNHAPNVAAMDPFEDFPQVRRASI
jgi:hypothetical protein